MVLWNRKFAASKDLAHYYAKARGIPPENVVMVHVVAGEETSTVEFERNVVKVIHEKLKTIKYPIDYIVPTKGMPILIWDSGRYFSFDAYLATMDKTELPVIKSDPPTQDELKQLVNPYFGKNEPFSSKKYGFYLVSRLDGYTYDDSKKLVDRSMQAQSSKGPFLFDARAAEEREGGYKQMHDDLLRAGEVMKAKGFDTNLNLTPDFIAPKEKLAGYASWGSNDSHFSKANYNALTFKPGALAETFVSTSARTLLPVTDGQSVVTDLIKQGVTGVKGYVREPYTFSLARPSILFDRYTSGYNLVESYFMASPFIKNRDILFGDPLCNPYKKR